MKNLQPDKYFQDMIMALEKFWADQGCLIWQPYYSQVGAGTMNPSTFLRVLGPEPFDVGYVEPSVRPDDGRYGENPNRLQCFYQYQVILKPDPVNPQEMYLRSLEAMGIDPQQHDIRFVEDNWESPALGAWGLGWEVWMDGLEITQFTYFQQAGGQTLNPVSVEITYGLDRIAAPLQGVAGFTNIQWNEQRTFGDMNLQAEQENSKYYFEIADVDRLQQMYDLYEKETEIALENELVLPAYDYVIKCSHVFNVLDSRGAIGVTERQAFFRRMRRMASKVAVLYTEGRLEQEYPWLDESAPADVKAKSAKKKVEQLDTSSITAPTDFLLEIGTEELPPADLDHAIEQLEISVPGMLADLRLEHGDVEIMGTPRRLIALVKELAPTQADLEDLAKGPPAARAFDSDGVPTRAAEGFARGKGVKVEDLTVQEIDGGEYVVAKVFEKGEPAADVLLEKLPSLTAGIKFDKSMRWNESNVNFSRPLRWLNAMHGSVVIPFKYAGATSSGSTRGLRFTDEETFTVTDPADHLAKLAEQGIIVDAADRRDIIVEQINAIAKEVGGEIADDPKLLTEVTHLVEAPTALMGKFDKEHLDLPREVLVSVMKKHQRYFPIEKDGKLLPYFITVRNGGDQHLDIVAEGNEAVVRARFKDAAFFVSEDRKQKLEDFLDRLGTLTFQKDLGSMRDKSERLVKLVKGLAYAFDLNKEELDTAIRAAELSKADLATSIVVEMTSLQGVMGWHYAVDSGETEAVGKAIFEHYLPRSASDSKPTEKPGFVLGIADRLDSLAGLFAAGLAPTGTKDPFAQRRAALGLIQNLIEWYHDFDLRNGLKLAAQYLPVEAGDDVIDACLTFIAGRMRGLFAEKGYRYDVIEAVLAEQAHNPAGAARSIQELNAWVEIADWETTLNAYSRCVRITRELKETYSVNEAALNAVEEKALFSAISGIDDISTGNMAGFFTQFQPLIAPITTFFDEVLVMAEDESVKQNRLAMLQKIADMTKGIADFSKLEGF